MKIRTATMKDLTEIVNIEALMEHFLKEAEKQGRKGVVLTCKDRLLHYYAKFGFENEGVSGSTHGDVVWYQMRKSF